MTLNLTNGMCGTDATLTGLQGSAVATQGSSFLATLGWKTQSRWDCRTGSVNSIREHS